MRPVYFIGVVIVSVIAPWWLTMLFFAWYAVQSRAYELVALGMLLDAYFGYTLPWQCVYTAVAAGLYIAAELLKPRLAFSGTPQ